MAKKKTKQVEEEPRQLTRKQQHLSARDRARNRKLFIGTAITLGVVALVLVFGIVMEFVVKPNSALAKVGEAPIITKDFQQRIRFEENQLENQYLRLQQLEQQFGSQSFFAQQLQQIQATLSDPFSLGIDVLDKMVEEQVIRQQAAERDISVSDEEVDAALREEVAVSLGAVTAPQATSTAVAAADATATAAVWTPTPTPTLDVSATVTATATALPTPLPPPTRPVLTDAEYQEGVANLESRIQEISGLSLADYREIVRVRLLRDKLAEAIGAEKVAATEEQVHARHILLREITPTPSPSPVPTGQPTPEPTSTATPLSADAPTPTPTPAPRTKDATLALAKELRQRILDGEDFAQLASEYSDDFGSAQSGGDLGWFGRGMMVPPFEEAAFSLPVGQVSEPVESQFGYHLIEVIEKDPARPKDEGALAQERSQAFADWLNEQTTAANIERPTDLVSRIPRDIVRKLSELRFAPLAQDQGSQGALPIAPVTPQSQ